MASGTLRLGLCLSRPLDALLAAGRCHRPTPLRRHRPAHGRIAHHVNAQQQAQQRYVHSAELDRRCEQSDTHLLVTCPCDLLWHCAFASEGRAFDVSAGNRHVLDLHMLCPHLQHSTRTDMILCSPQSEAQIKRNMRPTATSSVLRPDQCSEPSYCATRGWGKNATHRRSGVQRLAHLAVKSAGAVVFAKLQNAARLVHNALGALWWRPVRRAKRHEAVKAVCAKVLQVESCEPAARRVREHRVWRAAVLP